MIEPVHGGDPRADAGPFLQTLRRVCTECEVPLVFDEIITGFRLGRGGGQELFGVKADLATYGKIIGGGLPIGAVAGSERHMSVFDFARSPSAVFAGGTFNGNPLSMRVGCAVLRHLQVHPEIYSYLAEQSDRLANEVNSFIRREGFRARLQNVQSMFVLRFEADKGVAPGPNALAPRFYAHLQRNGVILPGIHTFFLSAAHTPVDVDTIIAAFQQSFRELREQGAL